MKIRYFHRAFIDSAKSLMNEFRDDTSNTLLVLGPNEIAYNYIDFDEVVKEYDKVIVFNQEPYVNLRWQPVFENFLNILRRADEVWDYNDSNIDIFSREHGINANLHILKPYMNWNMYAPVEKDIDILMYGSASDRREHLVRFLRQKYNVVTLNKFMDDMPDSDYDGLFGAELDDYILRSKILLNVHFRNDNFEQEQARMVKWLGAPCRIISERSTHNYLGVPEMDYWELFTI